MSRVGILLSLLAFGFSTSTLWAETRPNILWISVEDISPDLGCYGDKYADTPTLDKLAGQGVLFENCFSHAGVCAIARSGIITGMYPVSIGTQHMRSKIAPPAKVKCFTEYLRAAGYWCTNRSKTDYNFPAPASAWDENSRTTKDWEGRAKGQPFFCVINFTTTHESKIRNKFDKTLHDPAKATLPPYYPDSKTARRDWARYYDNITTVDGEVKQVLDKLEKDGLADNTIVMFWGDHGRGLPRGKRWLYESGIHVPLMVRWPGKIKPGSKRDDLVSFIDFAPTMLSLAGVDVPNYMHGRVFLGKGTQKAPEVLFGHRDRMDETYDLIRSVRSQQFKYLLNFHPHRRYAQHIDYMNKMPTLMELRKLDQEGKLTPAQQLFFRKTKPTEELYDLSNDPHELKNLADDPKFQSTLKKMRAQLFQWQTDIGDLGMVPEPIFMRLEQPIGDDAVTAKPVVTCARTFSGDQVWKLSCPTPGASLVYRLADDKNAKVGPQGWKLYTHPLRVPAGQTLLFKACRLGYKDSPIARQQPE